MQRADLFFDRPPTLQAHQPPEVRHLQRDEVRLLVTTAQGHTHTTFTHLAEFLEPGDLVVVNRSATLPASLSVTGAQGQFLLNLSTNYGDGVWLAEPRWNSSEPGPLPLTPGDRVTTGEQSLQLLAPYPGLPRLWFVRTAADLCTLLHTSGRPIRYGYVNEPYPLAAYQTIFAKTPGSAEMPSAADRSPNGSSSHSGSMGLRWPALPCTPEFPAWRSRRSRWKRIPCMPNPSMYRSPQPASSTPRARPATGSSLLAPRLSVRWNRPGMAAKFARPVASPGCSSTRNGASMWSMGW